MSHWFLFLLGCLTSVVSVAASQTDSWLEVRTPHFQVVSNGPAPDARLTARKFEAMRSVFQRVFPDADLQTPSPILVFAVQDKRSFQALEPAEYLANGQLNLIGMFAAAPEKNYVLILLDAPGTHPYAPIFHEYAHFVFSRLPQWMPLWLSEGIAEFYQNTEILGDKIRLGKGDPGSQATIERTRLLPLSTVFTVDARSPYYHDQDKGSIFYAESWALTHYLKDKDDAEHTHRIADYLDQLQKTPDPIVAARLAFGDLDQLESVFRRHALNGEYAVSEISGSTAVDDSTFTVQPISQQQADTLRAEFLAHQGRATEASALLQTILKDDPASADARQIMGYIAFVEKNFDEAQKWCQDAIKLDPDNFVAHYFFAAASIRKGVTDKASQSAVEESLRAAIRINPSFAPAYDALAIFLTMRGTNPDEARQLIDKAVELGPGVPEIRIDQSQILARINKTKEAIEVLERALKMCHTPEQSAAVEKVLLTLRQSEAEQSKPKRSQGTH